MKVTLYVWGTNFKGETQAIEPVTLECEGENPTSAILQLLIKALPVKAKHLWNVSYEIHWDSGLVSRVYLPDPLPLRELFDKVREDWLKEQDIDRSKLLVEDMIERLKTEAPYEPGNHEQNEFRCRVNDLYVAICRAEGTRNNPHRVRPFVDPFGQFGWNENGFWSAPFGRW